jgi:hypothetical protein
MWRCSVQLSRTMVVHSCLQLSVWLWKHCGVVLLLVGLMLRVSVWPADMHRCISGNFP